ncbi:uncharacterized protein LOC141659724 [Apium graveolens]|uniref:uncharacterized protein LOC141659724 n=1 Tax=Apium graveolens TaxID=4045 RepID=UPI003D7B0043
MRVPNVNLGKLDSRSKEVIYLDKESNTKAHRVYDPTSKSLNVTHDLVFEEDKSWDWSREKIAQVTQTNNFMVVGSNMASGDEVIEDNEGFSTPQTNNRSDSDIIGASESMASSNSGASTESESHPRQYRSLNDIYAETEPIKLAEEELIILGVDEPITYSKVAQDEKWIKAMKLEIDSVEKNNTWRLTELPPGRKAIDLKWVYKTKRDANREIIKHKARILAKGYVRKQGIDSEEVFAPVTRLETIRLLLALAAKNSWDIT